MVKSSRGNMKKKGEKMADPIIIINDETTIGTEGNDTYAVNADTKNATIDAGTKGADSLVFNINVNNISASAVDGSRDLLIRYTTDKPYVLTIKNYFTDETHTKTNSALKNISYRDANNITFEGAFTDIMGFENLYTINGKNVKGSNFNDIINLSTKTEGYIIRGNNGRDNITGSQGDDVIYGGAGNDYINGLGGNDTLKGGKGVNTYVAKSGDGHDRIILTKGETVNIVSTDIDSTKVGYTLDSKGNAVINYDKDNRNNGSMTLYGFGRSNKVKDAIIDVSDSLRPVDLKSQTWEKTVTKSYGGSYLNENISAEGYRIYKKNKTTGMNEVVTNVAKKGLYINGKNGNDTIVGSMYSDRIRAGKGETVSITGGTGNDKLYGGTSKSGTTTFAFHDGDGNDTVYLGKGRTFLAFDDADMSLARGTGKNKRNLIINYNKDVQGITQDSIVVRNYFDKQGNPNPNVFIKIGETILTFEELNNMVEGYSLTISDGTINGTPGKDILYGTSTNTDTPQNIFAKDGDDIIYCSNGSNSNVNCGGGNDTIYGGNYNGTGTNTYTLNSGDNTVYCSDGNTQILMGTGDDSIYMNGNTKVHISGSPNVNTGVTNGGNDVIYWGENVGDGSVVTFNKTQYNDMQISRGENSDDLIITYGDGNSVTFKDYFKEGNEDFGNLTIESLDNTGHKVSSTLQNIIIDKGGAGDDIYHASNLSGNLVINDNGGYDVLKLNMSSNDIRVLFNLQSDGTFGEGQDKLYIVKSDGFYNWAQTGTLPTDCITINGSDSIEVIQSNNGSYFGIEQLNSIKETIISWFQDNNFAYEDISTAIQDGVGASSIATIFNIDWQQQA